MPQNSVEQALHARERLVGTLVVLLFVGLSIAGFVLGLVALHPSRPPSLTASQTVTTLGTKESDWEGLQAEIDAHVATATPEDPFTVQLLPGTYVGDITLKPNVYVRGSDPTRPDAVRLVGTLRYEVATGNEGDDTRVTHCTLVAPAADKPAVHFTGTVAQEMMLQNVVVTHDDHVGRTVALVRMWNTAGVSGAGARPSLVLRDTVKFQPLSTTEGSPVLNSLGDASAVVPYGLDCLYGDLWVDGNAQFTGGDDRVALRVANSAHVNTRAHSLSGFSINGQVVLDKSRDLLGVTHGMAPFHFITHNMYSMIALPNKNRHGAIVVVGNDSVRDVVRFHNATFFNTLASPTFDPDTISGPFIVSIHSVPFGQFDVIFSSSTALTGTDQGDEFTSMTPAAYSASTLQPNRIFLRSATHG